MITFILIPLVFYFLVEQEDIKLCLLVWSIIFFVDYLIPSTKETYFQIATMIDLWLFISCAIIKDRWRMLGCMSVLALSALLNFREGLSYYQTGTYMFLTYYQWLSIEIIIAILLFKVRLRDVKYRKIC